MTTGSASAPRVVRRSAGQSLAALPHAAAQGRLEWLELLKAAALLWIVLNHLSEQLFGPPLIGNPHARWPPFSDRIGQLAPLAGQGIWDVPLNGLRYLGWAGDQGVQLFLIASGFGLTWGLLQRRVTRLDLPRFYYARALRVYPLWWAAHIIFLGLSPAFGTGLSLRDPRFYLSMLGFRAAPELLYYFAPAWWYVGLLVQLYLLYPLLWAGLRRIGATRLLLAACAIALPVRLIGLLLLPDGVDAWSRGAICITRLPEFVFGISMAAWMFAAPEPVDRRLRAPVTLLGAAVCFSAATALSLTLAGMAIAPFALGAGSFVLLYAALRGLTLPRTLATPMHWLGRHSFSLYLVHQPILCACLPTADDNGAVALLGRSAATLVLMPAVAIGLEWIAALSSVLIKVPMKMKVAVHGLATTTTGLEENDASSRRGRCLP